MRKLVTLVIASIASAAALAQDGSAMDVDSVKALASAFCIALAACGGAYAQGKAASVTFEGIARNPSAADKLFTPMIIALALIESLVIYAFVIAFMIKPA